MVERIRLLMQSKNLSSTQFADEIEVPRAVISHLLSGRNKPSLDVMLKIMQSFPEVSINWLLLGEGEMLTKLVKQQSPPASQPAPAQAAAAPQVSAQEAPATQAAAPQPPAPAPILPPAASQKTVAQIVVFYTDKTFAIYTSGDGV